MKIIAFLALVGVLAVSAKSSMFDQWMEGKEFNSTQSVGKNNREDADWMYVFAYSWTPGFCATQSNDPGCSDPEDYWKSHFTLHGLWPQYTDNGYPSFCTQEPFKPSCAEDVGMDTMEQYGPTCRRILETGLRRLLDARMDQARHVLYRPDHVLPDGHRPHQELWHAYRGKQ